MFGQEVFITRLPARMRGVFIGDVAHAIEIAARYSDDTEQVQMLKEFGQVREATNKDFYRIVRRS